MTPIQRTIETGPLSTGIGEIPDAVTAVLIQVQGGPVRWGLWGTTPPVSPGFTAASGQVLRLEGAAVARAFRVLPTEAPFPVLEVALY